MAHAVTVTTDGTCAVSLLRAARETLYRESRAGALQSPSGARLRAALHLEDALRELEADAAWARSEALGRALEAR